MSTWDGEERRESPRYGERLVRIEEGIKSLGRSVDTLRNAFERHIEEESIRDDKIEQLEKDFTELRGGAKVFLKMSAVVMVIIGGVWTVATWVAKIEQ